MSAHRSLVENIGVPARGQSYLFGVAVLCVSNYRKEYTPKVVVGTSNIWHGSYGLVAIWSSDQVFVLLAAKDVDRQTYLQKNRPFVSILLYAVSFPA